jgi:hypothetical protein
MAYWEDNDSTRKHNIILGGYLNFTLSKDKIRGSFAMAYPLAYFLLLSWRKLDG